MSGLASSISSGWPPGSGGEQRAHRQVLARRVEPDLDPRVVGPCAARAAGAAPAAPAPPAAPASRGPAPRSARPRHRPARRPRAAPPARRAGGSAGSAARMRRSWSIQLRRSCVPGGSAYSVGGAGKGDACRRRAGSSPPATRGRGAARYGAVAPRPRHRTSRGWPNPAAAGPARVEPQLDNPPRHAAMQPARADLVAALQPVVQLGRIGQAGGVDRRRSAVPARRAARGRRSRGASGADRRCGRARDGDRRSRPARRGLAHGTDRDTWRASGQVPACAPTARRRGPVRTLQRRLPARRPQCPQQRPMAQQHRQARAAAQAAARGRVGRCSERIGQWCHQPEPSMKLATYKDGSRDGQLRRRLARPAPAHYRQRHRHAAAAGARRLELPVAATRGPVPRR